MSSNCNFIFKEESSETMGNGINEPMDTIFVKSVREDGEAFQAGLRIGNT